MPEFISEAIRDGYVHENGYVNTDETTIFIKFYPGYTRRGFVSFETFSIPDDESIQSVILKIYIDHWQEGKNRGGILNVNKVSYGTLDSSDYDKTPDNPNIATINPGTVDGVWVYSSAFLQINKQGLSQYRIQYDAGNDLSFYAGSGDGNYKPVLIVTYGEPAPPPVVKRIVFGAWLTPTTGNNIVDMKCNVAHCYNWAASNITNEQRQAALDVAVNKGLGIYGYCTYRSCFYLDLLPQQDIDVINWTKTKDGFWGWQLFEEPGESINRGYATAEEVRDFVDARYAQVKALDPVHPLCITMGINEAVRVPFYGMDVAMPVCYPLNPGKTDQQIIDTLERYYGRDSDRGKWVIECQNRGIKIMPVMEATTTRLPCGVEWEGKIELQYDWWKSTFSPEGFTWYHYEKIMDCQFIFDGIVNTFETTTQYKSVQGSLSFSGNLTYKVKMPLSGVIAPSGSIVGSKDGQIRKSLSGKVDFSGDLNYKVKYPLSGDLNLAGSSIGTLRYELVLLFKKLMQLLQIEDDKDK